SRRARRRQVPAVPVAPAIRGGRTAGTEDGRGFLHVRRLIAPGTVARPTAVPRDGGGGGGLRIADSIMRRCKGRRMSSARGRVGAGEARNATVRPDDEVRP